MRSGNKLSALAVSKMTKPGAYSDGHGLYLQVSPGGSKQWIFRYMRDGRARKMGLGPIHTVSLAMAREKALECRRKLLDGIDPIDQRKEAKQARRVENARGITFREATEKYIAAHRAGWSSAKHGQQWGNTIEAYAYPIFGHLPVAAIDLPLIMKVLEPIWTEKAETASRVRGRIESVLDWASARNYRTGENPARWKGLLDKLLPARSKVRKIEHHAALPYSRIGEFMAELRAASTISSKAIEFLILTATRTSESINAQWSEIDLRAGIWIIPASRMKARKEHRVPLSPRALEILNNLPREDGNEFVFIGSIKGKPLSASALLNMLRQLGHQEITIHGMRSCFRDWAAETTAYPNEMVENALAHTIGNAAEAAYRRGDMLEKRARLMNDWAEFCAMPARTADVVPIRG